MVLLRGVTPERLNRWYAVWIQPALFDDVCVVTAWGSRATAMSRCRALPCPSAADAERTARRIVETRIRRGYALV